MFPLRRSLPPLLLAGSLLGLSLPGPSAAPAAPAYSIRMLEPYFEGGFGFARQINNRGTAVGLGLVDLGEDERSVHGMLWRGPTPIDLPPVAGTASEAYSINDSGLVVGDCTAAEDTGEGRTFLACFWRGGQPQLLSTPEGDSSVASGVNSAGTICGFGRTPVPRGELPLERSYIWTGGRRVQLPTPDKASSQCYAINDAGDAVGVYFTGGRDLFGFPITDGCLWKNRRFVRLAGFRNTVSHPFSLNNRGDAVGFCQGLPTVQGYPEQQACRWHNGRVIRLLTLGGSGGVATAINDRGDIVGISALNYPDEGRVTSHPFLLRDGRIFDLTESLPPDLGIIAILPLDINNRGQIVGFGVDEDFGLLSVVLTPK